MRDIRHFIDGKTFEGASGRFGDVFNPNTGEVQARVQLATEGEVDRAVQAAQAAFEGWAATNPQRRARVMFEFKRLVEANIDQDGSDNQALVQQGTSTLSSASVNHRTRVRPDGASATRNALRVLVSRIGVLISPSS